MEDFAAKTAAQLQSIRQLEEFISLNFRKKEVMPQLKELSAEAKDVRELVDDCARLLGTYYETALKEYVDLKRKMQEQQLTMLNIIKELKKRKVQSAKENITPTTTRGAAAMVAESVSKSQMMTTPRMYLSDYKQSPFVLRIRPVSLQFLDFETKITRDMFESIPKYMRGRETFDELTDFVDQVIVPCFTEKYQLLHKNRSCVKHPSDIQLWGLYQSQLHDFPGQKFITQGDISRKLNRLIDKKVSAKLMMLRHLGILKEERVKSTVYYLWVNKAM